MALPRLHLLYRYLTSHQFLSHIYSTLCFQFLFFVLVSLKPHLMRSLPDTVYTDNGERWSERRPYVCGGSGANTSGSLTQPSAILEFAPTRSTLHLDLIMDHQCDDRNPRACVYLFPVGVPDQKTLS